MWTTTEYAWHEAEETCQLIGMHLASISTPEEFQLVTGVLSGESYKTYSFLEQNILTPCRTRTALCIIYLGLQLEVSLQVTT